MQMAIPLSIAKGHDYCVWVNVPQIEKCDDDAHPDVVERAVVEVPSEKRARQ